MAVVRLCDCLANSDLTETKYAFGELPKEFSWNL
jgi:hypothetical protein